MFLSWFLEVVLSIFYDIIFSCPIVYGSVKPRDSKIFFFYESIGVRDATQFMKV